MPNNADEHVIPWPRKAKRPWGRVTLQLAIVNEAIRCVGVSFEAIDGKHVITGVLLRKLPVKELEAEAISVLYGVELDYAKDPTGFVVNADEMDAEHWAAKESHYRWVASLATPRRWSYTPEVLKAAAEVYREAHLKGLPPTKAVADQLFEGNRYAAERAVKLCRAKKISLPKSNLGRPKGSKS